MVRHLRITLLSLAAGAYALAGSVSAGVIFSTTQFETIDGITWMYVVNDGEATIGQGNMEPAIPVETSGPVTVPSTIGGYPVTAIESHAFYQCASITSLTIPDCVKSIGYLACGSCTSLETVRLPAGLTATPDSLFKSCTALTSAVIPESVTSFGRDAFWGCASLTNAVIPSSLTTLPAMTFYKCTSLRHVQLPSYLTAIGVSAFGWCTSLQSVEIPDSVTTIGEGAFEKCESLTELMLPTGLKRLECCLGRCTGLKTLKLPKGLETIADGALSGLMGLDGIEVDADNSNFRSEGGALCAGDELIFWPTGKSPVVIPDGIRVLGPSLFANQTSLASVEIPEGVEEIGNYAFYHTGLAALTLPSTLKKIGECAFLWTPLASVDVPAATETIGRSAFANSYSLASVAIRHPNVRLGNGVFANDSALSSVTFAGSVASVGSGVFYGCRLLPTAIVHNGVLLGYSAEPSGSVEVASGVTSIVGPVFGSQATSVTFPDTVTFLASDTFSGCSSLDKVFASGSVADLIDVMGVYVGTPSHRLVATRPDADHDAPSLVESDYKHWDDGDGYASGYVQYGDITLRFDLKVYVDEVDGYDPPTWGACVYVDQSTTVSPACKFVLGGETISEDTFVSCGTSADDYRPIVGTSTDYYLAIRQTDEKTGETILAWLKINGTTDPHLTITGYGMTNGESIVAGESAAQPIGVDGLGVAVPTSWAYRYPNFTTRYGYDFNAALKKPTGKTDGTGRALSVWHDFVAGTDPTDTNDVFHAEISFENGKPVVTWHPYKSTDGYNRVHTVYGKVSLDDEWIDVTNEKDLSQWSFFKVDVRVEDY